jgi:hypothetical protein
MVAAAFGCILLDSTLLDVDLVVDVDVAVVVVAWLESC